MTFAPSEARTPLKVISLSSLTGNDPQKVNWATVTPGTVIFRGPVRPEVQGRTLRFVCSNLRPTYADDILLYFHFHTFEKQ